MNPIKETLFEKVFEIVETTVSAKLKAICLLLAVNGRGGIEFGR